MYKTIDRCAPVLLMLALGGCGIAFCNDDFTTIRIASGLSRPLGVHSAPGDSDRLFIVEQRLGVTGRIRVLDLTANPPLLRETPFLNVTVSRGGEQGLLGLAFHPNYAANRRFFVTYTDVEGTTILAEYEASANPNFANAASGRTILQIEQPSTNHNGGWIDFGPDGYLYFATGDGGGSGDPSNQAQSVDDTLLGKILRIDIDHDDFPSDETRNYAIPDDNPFVGSAQRDEIWAYGLRNPWRCSFDRETGDLWIADVGQAQREEINVEPQGFPGGANYGWRCFEGTESFNLSGDCPETGNVTMPVYEYGHDAGNCSITGGFVYRGNEICTLRGAYLYADFCTSRIWSLQRNPTTGEYQSTDRTEDFAPIEHDIRGISSFGEDEQGNLYICDIFDGEVFQVVGQGAPTPCFIVGDMNCDSKVDLTDVTGFVLAFLLPAEYSAQHATCNAGHGDINGDGEFDARDIGPFVRLVLDASS